MRSVCEGFILEEKHILLQKKLTASQRDFGEVQKTLFLCYNMTPKSIFAEETIKKTQTQAQGGKNEAVNMCKNVSASEAEFNRTSQSR